MNGFRDILISLEVLIGMVGPPPEDEILQVAFFW